MKPEVAPTVLGLSRTRISPPRRRLTGTSSVDTLLICVSGTGVLPYVERNGHGVLGLLPVRVVRPDVLGQAAVDVAVQGMAARLVEAGRDVAVGLHEVEVQVVEAKQGPARDADHVRQVRGI